MTKLSYAKCCILGHFSDLLYIFAAARHVVYACLQNLIWGPTETASRWLPLPLYLFLVGVFCVFSSHILPFPALFSLTRWEPNGPALPIVVCVPMWLSPRTTTLAYSPSHPYASFFHNWIEMWLFSSATISGKHARYSVCSHTHTHADAQSDMGPLETLGKLDQDNTLTEVVYLPSSLLCWCTHAYPPYTKPVWCVCVCFHACVVLQSAST